MEECGGVEVRLVRSDDQGIGRTVNITSSWREREREQNNHMAVT